MDTMETIGDARVALTQEALDKGGPGATPEAWGAVRAKVLENALLPAQTLALADKLAKNGTAQQRAEFRAWLRVQAAAEQGQVFMAPPAIGVISKAGE